MTAEERRLLDLLAAADALLQAHGFMLDAMLGVVRAGLATAMAERVGGGCSIEVDRISSSRFNRP